MQNLILKIFIDIGHPAHVHYFRNSIKILKEKGHRFCITARDKDVTIQLMNEYEIDFFNRGKGGQNLFSKLWYGIKTNWFLFNLAISFKPDMFLSFASPYAAQVAKLMGKPHIAFTDTEHATLGNLAFIPFSHSIITPEVFQKNLGIKHIRFNGFMELAYLNKNYFNPTFDVLKKLNLSRNDKYVVIRLVAWTASHDIGHQGFSHNSLIKLIQVISKYAKVRITTEGEMHEDLQPYAMSSIKPSNMHHVLANAALFIGEGATMASECAVLGTPCIYVNTLSAGTIEEQEGHNLLVRLLDMDAIIKKAENILQNNSSKKEQMIRCTEYLENKINVTEFINWMITHFPASTNMMKNNPNYQDRFKV
jgi:predicted glycosyltransferase